MKRLYYWWVWYGRYIPRNISEGIRNLIKWFPTIWNDRDWDDHYIWQILKVKLTHQAHFTSTKGIHLNAERDAQRMRLCVRLIDKIQDEYYQAEYMSYGEDEFYFDSIEGTNSSQLRIEEISENYDAYFKKYPLIYKSVQISNVPFKTDTKKRIAMNIAHINGQRAKRLLFNIMDRHTTDWWD